jgi:hypothetical protein
MRDIIRDHRRQDRVREMGALAFGCTVLLGLLAVML